MKVEYISIANTPSLFFGWPANHGHWQWGEELIFGAAVGKRDNTVTYMHKVSGLLQKYLFRSIDGGETWASYLPNVDFEGVGPAEVPQWMRDYGVAEYDLRFCGAYDHGGEACDRRGAFYYSNNKCHTWHGPYLIDGVNLTSDGKTVCTTRTCHLGDLVFLTKANKAVFGTDVVVVANCGRNGPFNEIGAFPDPAGARQAMPAAAKLGNDIVVLCRRRSKKMSWISAYTSDDNGHHWRLLNEDVARTGDYNGNPPALLAMDNRLIAAYGNRSTGQMMLAISGSSRGMTWRHYPIKKMGCRDFGYPRLFSRKDGAIVCVYYVEGVLEAAIIREV